MKKTAFPSDQQDKFMLRLPDGMRERIKVAAASSRRSMNAEIVDMIEDRLSYIESHMSEDARIAGPQDDDDTIEGIVAEMTIAYATQLRAALFRVKNAREG